MTCSAHVSMVKPSGTKWRNGTEGEATRSRALSTHIRWQRVAGAGIFTTRGLPKCSLRKTPSFAVCSTCGATAGSVVVTSLQRAVSHLLDGMRKAMLRAWEGIQEFARALTG